MSLESIFMNLPLEMLRSWGYLILLLACLFESSPPLGVIIPGQTILILAGFFAKLHVFHLKYVFIIAAVGAILGDTFGYYLGKKFGFPFIKRYGKYFWMEEKNYKKTKKMIHKHTGKTLILGRFNSVTRAFAPFIAGMTKVPFGKFMFFNVVGGISWAFTFSLLGFLFGRGYQVASRYLGIFLIAAAVLSLLIIYGYRTIRANKKFIAKYQLIALVLNILSIYVFFETLEAVLGGYRLVAIDEMIMTQIQTIWNPVLNGVMIVLTNLLSPTALLFASFILFAWLLKKREKQASLILIFSMLSGVVLELLVKEFVQRTRPEGLIEVIGYSFPSGHATLAIIFFSALIYIFRDKISKTLLRVLFVSGCIFLVGLTGFTRVYLDVHWVSDVIAGYAVGLFSITFYIVFFNAILYSYQRHFR